MIKYSFNINEEIARWVTEVYIRNQQKNGWWVAFTNPIAGPWKKITALDGTGLPVEIYRFEREGERPDLILVNDIFKLVIIVEAKDYYHKLLVPTQMTKSVRVIEDISTILTKCPNKNWENRINYKILASFLWYSEDQQKLLSEDLLVREAFKKYSKKDADELLNIVISKDKSGNLSNNFIYKHTISQDLALLSK